MCICGLDVTVVGAEWAMKPLDPHVGDVEAGRAGIAASLCPCRRQGVLVGLREELRVSVAAPPRG